MTSRYQEGYVTGHKKGMADCEAEIEKLQAEVEQLRAGLRMLATQEYDAGYSPEDYAQAVLSGDEPLRALEQK